MTDDEKIAHLERALQEPEGRYSHDQIRQRLGAIRGAGGGRPMDLGPGSTDPDAPSGQAAQVEEPGAFERGAARVSAVAHGPAMQTVGAMANRAINTASFGAVDKAEDGLAALAGVRVGSTPEERQQLDEKHPNLAQLAQGVGYAAPMGLPARVGRLAGAGADELIGTMLRRNAAPVVSGAVPRAARVAGRAISGAMGASAAAGATRGVEDLVQGQDAEHAGQDALRAAGSPGNALLGGVMGGASGVLQQSADVARRASPDLKLLDRYGLEPGPVPGRPVIRKGQPISQQLPGMSEPPLGVSRVTPATRGAAARAAGDLIEGDLDKTEQANNRRYGELERNIMARQGRNPAHVDPILQTIDDHLADLGVHPETKAKLQHLRDQIEAPGGSGASGIAIPTKGGKFAQVKDLNGLRRLADAFANQDKAASVDDVPLRQVAGQMRDAVGTAAPALAELNARHSRLMTELDKRRALLGDPERQGSARNPYAQEREGASRAARIRQAGEETATGGGQETDLGDRMERLGDLGPAETHPGPGAAVPVHPGYREALDVPRLQLAQESLQIPAPHMFSGSRPGHGMLNQALKYMPMRVAYPLARRGGDATIGIQPVAADALIQSIRGRRKNQQGDSNAD